MSTAPLKYPLLMRILHWILALLLLGMIALGLIMSELPKETSYRGDLYMLHKSLGVTILALAALRLGLRLTRKLPDMPAVISRMDYLAARWAHRSSMFPARAGARGRAGDGGRPGQKQTWPRFSCAAPGSATCHAEVVASRHQKAREAPSFRAGR